MGYAYYNGNRVHAKRIPSIATIYTAELNAILAVIENALTVNNNHVTVITDSRSAIQGILKYNNSHPLITKILEKVKESNKFITLCWVPSHVGVDGNEKADKAAKEIIDTDETIEGEVPRGDYKCSVRAKVRQLAEEEWNKLREIKQNTQPFITANSWSREWERKLSRLRIGHTEITHQYLMAQEQRPYCDDCIVPLTVKHILIECPNYHREQQRYFRNNNIDLQMHSILGDDGPVELGGHLYNYMNSIGLFHRI